MASQLLVNVLSIGPLGAGDSTVVVHGLKSGDLGVIPTQLIFAPLPRPSLPV